MAEHQNDKTRDTQIIVRECNPIKSGTSQKTGEQWTMYQLVATKPDGTPIPQNLRSFEEQPIHEVIDVAVTPFVSESYGTSYTIKRRGVPKSQLEIEDLKRRLEAVEAKLGIQPGGQSLRPVPPPPSPVETPPPPPPVQPGMHAGNNDIPF